MSLSLAMSGLFAKAEGRPGRRQCPVYSSAALPMILRSRSGSSLLISLGVTIFPLLNIKTGMLSNFSVSRVFFSAFKV